MDERRKTCKSKKIGVHYGSSLRSMWQGTETGFSVSHSHIRNKRTFRPNLQPVRTTIDGENVRLRVCVKCIKAGKVQRVEA